VRFVRAIVQHVLDVHRRLRSIVQLVLNVHHVVRSFLRVQHVRRDLPIELLMFVRTGGDSGFLPAADWLDDVCTTTAVMRMCSVAICCGSANLRNSVSASRLSSCGSAAADTSARRFTTF
jgi:hypothetical protein